MSDRDPAAELMESLIRSFPARRLNVSLAEEDMTAVVRERLADGFDLPVPSDWRVLDHEDSAATGYGPSTVLVVDPNDAVYEVVATVRLRDVPRG